MTDKAQRIATQTHVTEVYQIVPGDWIRQELLAPTYGISAEAARKYRDNGLWLEEKHWRRDPANRIVYCRKEIDRWLGGQT